jgi:hypothetical protein
MEVRLFLRERDGRFEAHAGAHYGIGSTPAEALERLAAKAAETAPGRRAKREPEPAASAGLRGRKF